MRLVSLDECAISRLVRIWERSDFNHGQLRSDDNVYNVPNNPSEAAIDSLAPCDGYLFQITVSDTHPISRSGIDEIMNTKVFNKFKKRRGGEKPIQFVFIVEAPVYEKFKKQPFQSSKKEIYKVPSLRDTY